MSYGRRAASRAWFRLILAGLAPVQALCRGLLWLLLGALAIIVCTALGGPLGTVVSTAALAALAYQRAVHSRR